MKTNWNSLFLILISIVFLNPVIAQNNSTDNNLFYCQYKLNKEIYKTSTNCKIKICDTDDLELRLTNISQNSPESKFHIWQSPNGRLDYGKIRLLRNPNKYGVYKVNFTFDGKEIRKEFIVEKNTDINCDNDTLSW